VSVQSRRDSFVESWTNIFVGIGIGYGLNITVLPAFGYDVTYADATGLTAIYTAVSFARSYVLRRIFTQQTEKGQL